MRRILTILFCLISLISLAQNKRYKGAIPFNGEGHEFKRVYPDSALALPRFSQKFDTSTVKYMGRMNDALIYADTLGSIIYWYNPHTGIVDTVNGRGNITNTNYYNRGIGAFSDTIKYPADGTKLDITFYEPGRTVTSVTTGTLNGSGFLPNWGKQGDSLHIPYSIAPIDTVIFIISGTVVDTTVLDVPNAFAAPLGTHDIMIGWNNVPHNSGYILEYRYANTGYFSLAALEANDTMYQHSGIPPDTTVYYRVRAVGDSVYYGSNFGFTNARTEALVPLQTPSITATANSSRQITINWNSIPNASGYVLIYSTDGQFFSLVDTLSSGTTSYIHDTLSTGTQIWYKVQALGDDDVYGNSDFSDTASARTFALTPVGTPNLVIDSTHTTDVYMHWNSIADATAYLVRYSTDSLDWQLATLTGPDTTFFIHRDLTPNKKYYYQLQAKGNGETTGDSPFDLDSATTQQSQLPFLATPVVTLTAVNPNQNNISYSNVANETGYDIYRSLDSAAWTLIKTNAANVITYSDTGLTANTKVFYKVQAKANNTTFQNSDFGYKSITTLPLITLSKPTLTVVAPIFDSSHSTWTNISNESGFIFGYSLDKVNWVFDTLPANTLSFGHSNLVQLTKYYYEVAGYGDQKTYGNSAFDLDSVITPAQPAPSPDTLDAPSPLDATAVSTRQNNISWANQAGETGYQIERSTNKSVWTIIKITAADVTSYSDTGLISNTKYYYRALTRAGTGFVNSIYSNIDSATTLALTVLATPTTDATAATSTSNTVTWTNVANESGFVVRYSLNKSSWTVVFTSAANVLTFTHINLNSNTKYYYQTQAKGDSITYASSAWSNIDSATTLAPQPTALDDPSPLNLTVVSGFRIDASWANVANESAYKLDISTNGTTWTNKANPAANVTTFSITGLQPATFYYVRVQATTTGTTFTNSAFVTSSATTLDTATSPTITHGALIGIGSVTQNKAGYRNLGVTNIRTSYQGKTANYPAYTDEFKTFLNFGVQTPGDGLPLPTDSSKFACTLDSMFMENGVKNIIGLSIINEPNNVGYYTDNISAGNYLRLLQACANVAHRWKIPIADGGFTGPVMRYMVWEDFKKRGFADSASTYAALAFEPGQNPENWRTSSNYASRIKYMDTIVANLKNVTTDFVNIHWYETVRDADATKSRVSLEAFIETARYYSRMANKPVITNEYGLNNNDNVNILSDFMDALKTAHIKHAFIYGVGNLNNADGSLTPLGQMYKSKIAGQ